MPNITIAIDEDTLKASREYARSRNTSLNALIREMLRQRVARSGTEWLEQCFALMDQTGAVSDGRRWTRDELHER